MEAVKLSNINVSIDGIDILENVNLSIPEKEFLGIIGPNLPQVP